MGKGADGNLNPNSNPNLDSNLNSNSASSNLHNNTSGYFTMFRNKWFSKKHISEKKSLNSSTVEMSVSESEEDRDSLSTKAGPSPELTANTWSFLFWSWMTKFMQLGYEKPLQAEDLYEMRPDESTQACVDKWDTAWATMVEENNGEVPHVWALLWRCYCWEFFLAGSWQPLKFSAVILQVFVLKGLVSVADGHTLKWWWGTLLVIGMLATSITQSLAQHHCFTASQKLGMKVRSTVCYAVFKKVLQMRTAAMAGSTQGHMLNLITNDTQKLLDAATYFHFVWFAVVELSVICSLVLVEAGVAGLGGVFIVFLTQPLQIWMAKRVGRIRRSAVQLTDARVRLVSEILSSMRAVKFNGWTAPFIRRISELRKPELSWIRQANYFRSANSAFKDTVTPLASLTTFAIYIAIHDGTLKPTTAFAILAFFSLMVRVFFIAPQGLQFYVESRVAVQRLQKFLELPNGNGFSLPEESAKAEEENPEAAVGAFRTDFDWSVKETIGGKTNLGKKGKKGNQEKEKSKRSLFKKSSQGASSGGTNKEVKEESLVEFSLRDIDVLVGKEEIVAVTGPVGSGKSSLLLGLLGEMEHVGGVFFAKGEVAYVPQQPWIFNDTVKNNILFGQKFDMDRYKLVCSACALDLDISQLPALDDTEIGERGVNLSGGQKARISLARAAYSRAPIAFLDDPLAAVDVPTAKHLMENVLRNVLRNRSVILVTHNQRSLSYCNRIVGMDHGRIKGKGEGEEVDGRQLVNGGEEEEEGEVDVDKVLEVDIMFGKAKEGTNGTRDLRSENEEERRGLENGIGRGEESNGYGQVAGGERLMNGFQGTKDGREREGHNGGSSVLVGGEKEPREEKDNVSGQKHEQEFTGKMKSGRVTVEEDRALGVVSGKTYYAYIMGGGGWGLFLMLVAFFIFSQAVRTMVDYWLGVWVDHQFRLKAGIYAIIYGALTLGAVVLSIGRALLFTYMSVQSASTLHDQMAFHVLRSPQIFFDQNPVGRILNRFSKDQSLVDELLPITAQVCLELFLGCIGSIVIISVLVPWVLLCLPPLVVVYWILQRRYTAVSRELKRLDGLSRSPMYAHFAQAVQGIASVRAYGASDRYMCQFVRMIDANHRAYVLFIHAGRWLGIRLDMCAAVCVTVTALSVVLLRDSLAAGLAGVALVQSLQLSGFLQYGVRQAAETENFFTSVERIHTYTELPVEADSNSPEGLISKDWPERGEMLVENLVMAYREDLPTVLNGLTFQVEAGEKIGILGRTGVGKSSIAAALFRLVENEACKGRILIDGMDIKRVGLDDLRQRLSIIPQDPVLFKGTIRQNLDPFEVHNDADIMEVITQVHLDKKLSTLEGGLDSSVSENGDNFSVGERQLLCLARALLRKSRVIVMDEATAAVDGATDSLLQEALSTLFEGRTVLAIAHRLRTVASCDRVLLLGYGGRVAEYDSPSNLLRRGVEGGSLFANMVNQSGAKVAEELQRTADEAEAKRQKRKKSA